MGGWHGINPKITWDLERTSSHQSTSDQISSKSEKALPDLVIFKISRIRKSIFKLSSNMLHSIKKLVKSHLEKPQVRET